ncbi:MAG TPA: methyltransferase domain-containing protein [Stellaceae bacterium]|jgi:SAM-dependent methyltransferase
MTANPLHATPAATAVAADARLDWLLDAIRRNRFLPVPPPEKLFIGDGDYLAIGAEFLGHFVRIGGLAPGERVLDIGCGIGRMAVPLTQYLDESGSYDGADIVADGIGWCREAIGSRYERFRFHHLDQHHPLYNPQGAVPTAEAALPFPDGAFDFVFLTSVTTHLEADALRRYAEEIRRVLAPPGGRCFVTAFLMNGPARDALRATDRSARRLPFDPDAAGPVFYAYPEQPTAAVAFDEDFFLASFLAAGLRRKRPAVYGHWSGRRTPVFQDICVLDIADR